MIQSSTGAQAPEVEYHWLAKTLRVLPSQVMISSAGSVVGAGVVGAGVVGAGVVGAGVVGAGVVGAGVVGAGVVGAGVVGAGVVGAGVVVAGVVCAGSSPHAISMEASITTTSTSAKTLVSFMCFPP